MFLGQEEHQLRKDVQSRLSSHGASHILHRTPPTSLGLGGYAPQHNTAEFTNPNDGIRVQTVETCLSAWPKHHVLTTNSAAALQKLLKEARCTELWVLVEANHGCLIHLCQSCIPMPGQTKQATCTVQVLQKPTRMRNHGRVIAASSQW